MSGGKHSVFCVLQNTIFINNTIFRLDFAWQETTPKAGQFFMIKPRRGSVFLARPISVAETDSTTVRFLIARRGKGTEELAAMRAGEEAELTGPLGNAWTDFLPAVDGLTQPVALIGGGIGLAPLYALLNETAPSSAYRFDLYAGFRTGFHNAAERDALLGPAPRAAANIMLTTEDGTEGRAGRIPDLLEPERYAAVCACGPELMLRAVTAKCAAAGVPCYISLERRMACGEGACLGCTVATVNGNRRCCADGPIFRANEVIFDV